MTEGHDEAAAIVLSAQGVRATLPGGLDHA